MAISGGVKRIPAVPKSSKRLRTNKFCISLALTIAEAPERRISPDADLMINEILSWHWDEMLLRLDSIAVRAGLNRASVINETAITKYRTKAANINLITIITIFNYKNYDCQPLV